MINCVSWDFLDMSLQDRWLSSGRVWFCTSEVIGIWIEVDTGYLRQLFLSNIVWFILKSVPMCCADNANQSNHTSRYFEQIGQKSTDSHELRDSDEDRKLKWRPWDLWYPILQFQARYENEIENHEITLANPSHKPKDWKSDIFGISFFAT